MKIFLVAGEPSGDLLGARLMAGLKELQGDVMFCGVGGPRMIEQGMESLFPMSDLTLMGLAEVLPKIPLILRRIRQTVQAILAAKPDVVVTIDAPDFCFRVAKKLLGSRIPFVHYVAPTVWAWRPGRARKIMPLFRRLLTLFPFEPPYFERVGLPATFVGHPLVEAGIEEADAKGFIARHGLNRDKPLLVMLPGSRRSELKTLLGVFGGVVPVLAQRIPGLQLVLPAVPHLADKITQATQNWPIKPLIVTADGEKYAAFKAANAALAASGTVALELGLALLPSVTVYKVHPITAALYRHLIKTKFVNLINIMAGHLVVPEFLQENCTVKNVSETLIDLLENSAQRERQLETLSQVKGWLSPPNGQSPRIVAAQAVIDTVKARQA